MNGFGVENPSLIEEFFVPTNGISVVRRGWLRRARKTDVAPSEDQANGTVH
jgi:hypothetical protein